MPPQPEPPPSFQPQPSPPAPKPTKPYFFYGKRKPSQNRPKVFGGLFSNRQTLNPKPQPTQTGKPPSNQNRTPFSLQNWHNPDPTKITKLPSSLPSKAQTFFQAAKTLPPLARYICDTFRRHNNKWGPEIISDLSRLRRVNPDVVAQVLKVQDDASVAAKFFHWAGKQKGYTHDFVSYNAFAYCLNRCNRFRAADQVPELMHMQGKTPSEKQFEILIRMHADSGRGGRVWYVYDKMRNKFGVKPRVFLYNRVMDALVKTGHLDKAVKVYEDFKEDGLVEEAVTFMIVVKGLCKGGRIDEVVELLGKMRRTVCKPDVFAYTAMIRVLVGEGNLDGCLRVWEEMEKDGVEPDAMAYTTVVTALCRGGRVEKGYEIFEGVKKKGKLVDRDVYHALVEGFVEVGKVGMGIDLLKDMLDSGYRADLPIYNSLIKGLCNVKQLDKACKLFKVTVNEGLGPDFVTLNPILLAYAELREMDKFCDLLVQMEKLGNRVVDGLSTFFSVMVEEEERLPLALEVFENLKAKGYFSLSIYNVLLGALYKSGSLKIALTTFNELVDSDIEPDSTAYSHAITCLVDLEDVKAAALWYNKIKEASGVPSVAAYRSLVKGLCKIGHIDAAFSLVQDCLANVADGPVEFKYALNIRHTCKSNNASQVLAIIYEMVEQDYPPNEIIYCAVISGMCEHGTIEEARKVFSDMQEGKHLTEACAILYDDLLIEHMKRKAGELVMTGLKFFGLENKLRSKGLQLPSS